MDCHATDTAIKSWCPCPGGVFHGSVPSSPASAGLIFGALVLDAFGMISFCLDLVRALDPGECHLVEEGFVGVVTHDARQTQAFDGLLLTLLGYRHVPPPQYTDQQRLIGVYGSGKIGAAMERAGRMSALLTHGLSAPREQR
jgi:hypothetical protein